MWVEWIVVLLEGGVDGMIWNTFFLYRFLIISYITIIYNTTTGDNNNDDDDDDGDKDNEERGREE